MSKPNAESPPLTDKPIDVNAMLKRCMNNHKIVLLMLEKFREQAQGDLETLRIAIPAGDSHRVFEVAHALKGAARLLSAERVCDVAMKLESMGRSANLESAGVQLQSLETEVRACLDYIPTAIRDVS